MRIGENFNPQAGLENEENQGEVSVEELEAANEQLSGGFELSGDPEELMKNYEALFEGIEETELEYFKEIINGAPMEAIADLKDGDTGQLVEYAKKKGFFGKKVVQLVAVALVTFFAANAFAAGEKISKVSMDSAGSGIKKMERLSTGGGGVKPNLGGKIMMSGGDDDFEKKVAEYNKIKNGGSSVDENGNGSYVGGTYIDGERVN